MKRCLACQTHFPSLETKCPNCSLGLFQKDGFTAYSPDMAIEGDGFKSSYFSELAPLEETHFWFRARNQLIIWALKNYCANFNSCLEIGCGTGYVLSGIAKTFSKTKLHGSEIFTEGLSFAATRLPAVDFMQMDARNIPFAEEFDAIGAFDVLEHIKEDELVLNQIYNALKPKGFAILTVPQHAWLWSPIDDYACHVRRYSASDLHFKLKNAGFNIARSTSFVTTLLPAMILSRLSKKNSSLTTLDASSELKIKPWLNAFFYQCLLAELALIKTGVNFPIGGSRLIIAKKVA